MTTEEIIAAVKCELDSATHKFGPFASAHEGYAVILEELDELWDEIKKGQRQGDMLEEAIQIAAMAVRFCIDICGPKEQK